MVGASVLPWRANGRRAPYASGLAPYDPSLSLYKNPNPGVTENAPPQVPRVCRAAESLEQVELSSQLRPAGHRRRAREQRVASIRAFHRLALGRVVARQVGELHGVPLGVEVGHQPLGDFPFVEGVGAAGRDLLERPGEVRTLQRVAGV